MQTCIWPVGLVVVVTFFNHNFVNCKATLILAIKMMPLPLTVSCFSKIQIGFTFLALAHLGSPGKRAVKRVCVCVCVLVA